jgi:SAM-dependent methyltransferase
VTATSDAYFDSMWTVDDPWDQTARFSELRKYQLTVASLPRERYRLAFEPGCATGVLTALLAERCDHLIATDRHPHAVAVAQRRTGGASNVEVQEGRLPDDWPRGDFDLVVLSEVLYYLEAEGVNETLTRAARASVPGAHLVTVQYRPLVEDHALLGDEVDDLVAAHPGWRRLVHHDEADFLLSVSVRA